MRDPLFRPRPTEPRRLKLRDRPCGAEHLFAAFGVGADATVFIANDVLERLRRFCSLSAPNETIGVLAGTVSRDESGTYVVVRDIEEAWPEEKQASPGFVSATFDGSSAMRKRVLARNPAFLITGWWHSHPAFAPRFSHEDFIEQSTLGPNQIGVVVSGLANSEAGVFGVYHGPSGVLLKRWKESREVEGRPSFRSTPTFPAGHHERTSGWPGTAEDHTRGDRPLPVLPIRERHREMGHRVQGGLRRIGERLAPFRALRLYPAVPAILVAATLLSTLAILERLESLERALEAFEPVAVASTIDQRRDLSGPPTHHPSRRQRTGPAGKPKAGQANHFAPLKRK